MYKTASGRYKSDFMINGTRYQKTWENATLAQAKVLEKQWKKEIKANISANQKSIATLDFLLKPSVINKTMKLSEVSEWMLDRVWRYNDDCVSPVSRFRTIISMLGDIDITEFDTQKMYQLKSLMLIEGFNGKIYTPKTFNHIVSLIKKCMETLEQTNTISLPNKPNFIDFRVPEKSNRIVVFTDEELKRIREYYEERVTKYSRLIDVEMLDFVIINSNLGLRPAEFLALTIKDIDFNNKTVTISKAIKTHNPLKTLGDTKNGLTRTLPIDGITLNTFNRMVGRIREVKALEDKKPLDLYLKEGKGLKKGLYYWIFKGYYNNCRAKSFLDCNITTLSYDAAGESWKSMKKALGLTGDEYGMYALRHTVATRLVSQKKFSAHKLMLYLGHTNIQTGLKYVHLCVDDIRDGCGVGIDY